MSTVHDDTQNVEQWERFPGHFTEHYIEESVAVYLERDPNGENKWVIDPTTLDPCGLESNLEEPENGNCECGDEKACHAAHGDMSELPLPNGEELFLLLADALGYHVLRKDGVHCGSPAKAGA